MIFSFLETWCVTLSSRSQQSSRDRGVIREVSSISFPTWCDRSPWLLRAKSWYFNWNQTPDNIFVWGLLVHRSVFLIVILCCWDVEPWINSSHCFQSIWNNGWINFRNSVDSCWELSYSDILLCDPFNIYDTAVPRWSPRSTGQSDAPKFPNKNVIRRRIPVEITILNSQQSRRTVTSSWEGDTAHFTNDTAISLLLLRSRGQSGTLKLLEQKYHPASNSSWNYHS